MQLYFSTSPSPGHYKHDSCHGRHGFTPRVHPPCQGFRHSGDRSLFLMVLPKKNHPYLMDFEELQKFSEQISYQTEACSTVLMKRSMIGSAKSAKSASPNLRRCSMTIRVGATSFLRSFMRINFFKTFFLSRYSNLNKQLQMNVVNS